MTKAEAVNWIINISADIGKIEHQDLWHYEQALDEIREMLEAEPERKIGKWNIWAEDRTEWYHVTCSECVEDVTATIPLIGMFPNYKALWDYCPYCGAKMVEDEDE